MNDFRKDARAEKWQRAALKSSWYDEHEGFSSGPLDALDNRSRLVAQTFVPADQERASSSDVERFFDLFDANQEH